MFHTAGKSEVHVEQWNESTIKYDRIAHGGMDSCTGDHFPDVSAGVWFRSAAPDTCDYETDTAGGTTHGAWSGGSHLSRVMPDGKLEGLENVTRSSTIPVPSIFPRCIFFVPKSVQ